MQLVQAQKALQEHQKSCLGGSAVNGTPQHKAARLSGTYINMLQIQPEVLERHV
jgi:hypothetical protein